MLSPLARQEFIDEVTGTWGVPSTEQETALQEALREIDKADFLVEDPLYFYYRHLSILTQTPMENAALQGGGFELYGALPGGDVEEDLPLEERKARMIPPDQNEDRWERDAPLPVLPDDEVLGPPQVNP